VLDPDAAPKELTPKLSNLKRDVASHVFRANWDLRLQCGYSALLASRFTVNLVGTLTTGRTLRSTGYAPGLLTARLEARCWSTLQLSALPSVWQNLADAKSHATIKRIVPDPPA
jgi:hypothetical protein